MYQQFALLFLLIVTGFLCRKYNIVTDAMMSGLNKFIIVISFPCLILYRTSNLDIDHKIFTNFLITLLIFVCLMFIFALYAYFYTKARKFPRDDTPVIEFSICCPNNGFMGFPIAMVFFGDIGLLYMIACNLGLNVFFFSYGVLLMKRDRIEPGQSLKKKILELIFLLINPKICSAVVGLIICYNQINLPEIIDTYLSTVGAVASPMAMIYIGTTIVGGLSFSILKDRAVIEAGISKLLVVPIITILIVFFLPIDPLVKNTLIIANTLPVATTVPIFSQQYDRNKKLASEILIVSTIVSMVTIPMFVWITNHLPL